MPFLFSSLVVTGKKALSAYNIRLITDATVDDDTFLESSSSCSVGEIKLVIHSITILGSALMTDSMYNAPPLPQKVHERSKKAIAHGVKYVACYTLYSA